MNDVYWFIIGGTVSVLIADLIQHTRSPRSAHPKAETTREGGTLTDASLSAHSDGMPGPSESGTPELSEEGMKRLMAAIFEHEDDGIILDPDGGPLLDPPTAATLEQHKAWREQCGAVTDEEFIAMAADLSREARPLTYEPVPNLAAQVEALRSAVWATSTIDAGPCDTPGDAGYVYGWNEAVRQIQGDASRALAMVQHPAGGGR